MIDIKNLLKIVDLLIFFNPDYQGEEKFIHSKRYSSRINEFVTEELVEHEIQSFRIWRKTGQLNKLLEKNIVSKHFLKNYKNLSLKFSNFLSSNNSNLSFYQSEIF